MENLAGISSCDIVIKAELENAGITVVRTEQNRGEVSYSITGEIPGEFTMFRLWTYWVIDGYVPLNVANILYSTDIGKKNIQVKGDCSCPAPMQWAKPKPLVLLPQLKRKGKELISQKDIREMIENGEITGDLYIDSYHIDSQEGLNLFIETLRKHNTI